MSTVFVRAARRSVELPLVVGTIGVGSGRLHAHCSAVVTRASRSRNQASGSKTCSWSANCDVTSMMNAAHTDDDSADAPVTSAVFKVAAIASVAGMRDTCGNVPLDACVPVRLEAPVPTNLGSQSEWILIHVDGARSLKELAVHADISLPETIEAYLDLLLRGLVDARLPSNDQEQE